MTTATLATAHLSHGQRRHTTIALARYATHAARIALGSLFLMSGLNGFLEFIPPPSTPVPAGAIAFAGALASTGYMMQLICATEAAVGLLLLLNRFVPLALVLLAPVVVNIVAFHVFLAPAGLGMALVVLALELGLAWRCRDAYRGVLSARVALQS
jgi:uncharacterized membrane protein YphA (DoxX/SURF4 family)